MTTGLGIFWHRLQESIKKIRNTALPVVFAHHVSHPIATHDTLGKQCVFASMIDQGNVL